MSKDTANTFLTDDKVKQYTTSDIALDFKSEEFNIEKKYFFNSNRERLAIYKPAETPYVKVFLKALAYHLYKPLYDTLQIDPPLYRKYKPDLMSLNYSNEPTCWIECFERDFEKIEFICKHIHPEEFILVEISEDITSFIEQIKKKVHYKYHHLISVLNFVPEIVYYIDPEEIVLIRDWFDINEVTKF